MPVTLLSLMTALAGALDDLGQYTVASATSSSVVSSAMIDATPGASIDRYNGRWAYAASQQRVVETAGFTPSTGTLVTRSPWTSNPTAGMMLYLTGLFPMASAV